MSFWILKGKATTARSSFPKHFLQLRSPNRSKCVSSGVSGGDGPYGALDTHPHTPWV